MEGDARQDPLLGRTVADGRYEVLALLGVGGMGTVYRALQHPLERQVALKLIHRALATNETIVARFNREMRLTASIEHPHTVRVYDVGEIDGQPFLAMEYLAGRSLREVLDASGALPVERLAAIGLQVAKALRAAHQAGIVHRDLKPDNVLLVDGYGERDFVKVLDFGIARTLEQEVGFQTVAGAIVGTPTYMSPEQATGEAIDTRSDLYSLGVMLFEMATGTPPFLGRTTTALLLAHARDAPPSLDGYGGLPEEVRSLIARLLEKDPAARPANAEAIMEVLAPLVASETGSAAPGVPSAPRNTGGPRSSDPGARPPSFRDGAEAAPAVGGTLAFTEAPPARGDAPAPAGTRILSPGDDAPPDGGRAARGGAATPPRAGRNAVVAIGLLAVAAAGGLAYRRWDHGHPARDPGRDAATARSDDAAAAALEGGAAPGALEALDPATAARLLPSLQSSGEPPWPAPCRSRDTAVLRRLADLASALAGADAAEGAPGRAAVLAAIRALPAASAERWVVEARATLGADAESAARASAEAVSLCPSSAVAHNLLGNALQRLQRLERAEEAYRAATRLAPPFLAPRFNLGLIQLRRNDAAAALATFAEIGHADADYPNLPLVRAEAHRRQGDAASATADLKEQVKRHPKVADGWLQLGRALTGRDKGAARAAYCQAKALGSAAAAPLCRR